MNLLFTLAQVKQTMRTWRHDYIRGRPHSPFGGVPPSYRSGQITHGAEPRSFYLMGVQRKGKVNRYY